MCSTGQAPASVSEALDAVEAGLAYLNQVEAAGLPGSVQAESLRKLARAEAAHTAAHARLLAAFRASSAYDDDGQGSARMWLRWQTQATRGAADGAMGWMRRLAAHPALADALAGGRISRSYAHAIAEWTGQLPAGHRAAADQILLDAAAGGATLADLAGLAEEMRARTATPDRDRPGGDGFAERRLRLDVTFGGAGRLDGDLTPACAAALAAVLASLGAKAGPEDTRTPVQRDHDALEEACRRLAGSGCLPARAGQATHVQLHLTLDQLRDMPGGPGAEAAWAAGQATGDGQPGWLAGRAAQAYACDAAIAPAVTGHLDPAALDTLASAFRSHHPAAAARLRATLLRYAADVLSGPGGLAAFLRTRLTGGQFPAVSLPLDVGAATPQVPAQLRRAVTIRDRHCAFPGCDQPPPACHVHHLRPKADGGPSRLDNLVLLCSFHHLIAVHRWDWQLTLHPDGTTTARSPDRSRTLHSHGPPVPAA